MQRTLIYTLTFLLSIIFMSPAHAQDHKESRNERYIRQYALLAQMHQVKYKIPAAITLAQGILESSGGESELTLVANNHFGIEAHYWNGPKVKMGGREYRAYGSAEESFEDHSQFLLGRRYSSLFELEITDYKGWARGLKQCGYAEDKQYAQKLIRVVEDNDLAFYTIDAERAVAAYEADNGSDYRPDYGSEIYEDAYGDEMPDISVPRYDVWIMNGLKCVIAHEGDTYEKIGRVVGVKAKKLAKYNECDRDRKLKEGEIVYLQKKHRKGEKGCDTHVVAEGETLHSISQQYGVQVRRLARRNKMRFDAQVTVGVELRLR